MIKNISWASYFYAIIVFVVIYYLVIFIKYYLVELQGKFAINKHHRSIKESLTLGEFSDSSSTEMVPDITDKNLFTRSQDLIGELHGLIQKALVQNLQKEELRASLRSQLKHYRELKGTAFQVAVNNFIAVETQIHCSINLSEDELQGIWDIGGGAF